MPRSTKVFKKCKFRGNQFINNAKPPSPRPTAHEANLEPRPKVSSSKSKLASLAEYDRFADCNMYDIVDLKSLEETLKNVAVCKQCHASLQVNKKHIAGLACEIRFECGVCDSIAIMNNCDSIEANVNEKKYTFYDLNMRLVYSMRSIGKGKVAAEKVSGIMNLSAPISNYHVHEGYLGSISEQVSKMSMENAIEEAVKLNSEEDRPRDLAVANDGSWQKRGHTSLNGILSTSSLTTGKIVDIDIMSKFCSCTKKPSENVHGKGCYANFSGTSGAMEVAGAKHIFGRSEELYNVRYVEYLGDGDSKAYQAVCDEKPYGDEVNITKVECVGHIQKRVGTRLRKMKEKTKKLPDGTPLGGKSGLTLAAIKQLQNYYGLAIRRNTDSVEGMRTAIWALYFHVMSTDQNPTHQLCPKEDTTWCKYNAAKSKGEEYAHKKHFHLPEKIMTFIKPLFRDLSKPELLEKCLKGRTQNVNESFNNVVWSYVPKKVFVQLPTLKFGVYEAVTNFNDGNIGKCKVMQQIGIRPGANFVKIMKMLDERRIKAAEKTNEELAKKIRQRASITKRKIEDDYEEAEGHDPSYASGLY